jgi:predicted signal transduction protein with EAL and GGDEF domain
MHAVAERLKELTILYSEDEEAVREATVSILSPIVKQLIVAQDGMEGLELFGRHAEEIDIILTDISMPRMDGLEMVRTIKKTHPNLPVIVTTAFSNSEFLLKAIDINVDKYVLKPIDVRKLIEAISQSQLYHEMRLLYWDALTHLPTRNALLEDLKAFVLPTVALIDIDRFSEINEIYGIAKADRILAAYARELKRTFDSEATVYREGADSFALVYADPEYPLESIEEALEVFIGRMEDTGVVIDGEPVGLMTVATVAHTDPDAFNHAQQAIIEAKRGFRKLSIFQAEPVRGRYEEDIRWIREIKEAGRAGRFTPSFQPIYDTRTGEVVKFEALLRYHSEDGTPLPAKTFLAIARRVRMYGAVMRAVLAHSIGLIRRWGVTVSVNISYEDISNPHTQRFILDTLAANPVEAKRIDFEILESEIIEDYRSVKAFMEEVRRYGCGVGIDDFGSGYSNLTLLEQLDIDFLKIDGALIEGLAEKPRRRYIVESIQEVTRKLGITTVAEKVSDDATYAIVRELGIDYTQGWYFAGAVPAEEVERYVHKHDR